MLAIAEFGLFVFVGVGAVFILFWLIFGAMSLILSVPLFGVSRAIHIDLGEAIPTAAFGTIIGWPICMIVGGIVQLVGLSGLWTYSPFGYMHGKLHDYIFSWLAAKDVDYGWCRDGSAILSYGLITLLITIGIVMFHIVKGELASAKSTKVSAH